MMAARPFVVLAVNIGSSSVKYAAYAVSGQAAPWALAAITKGNIERKDSGDAAFYEALRTLKGHLSEALGEVPIAAVAHRVVHGGARYTSSVVVTEPVLKQLHDLDRLAPLHQPFNLQGIASFSEAFPGVPQVACFDTAFHTTIPDTEKAFPLSRALYEQGIRRYGFHGLSYQFVSETLMRESTAAKGRLLMAHLGNGASLCACSAGKSLATTMGFSAAGGLMMGTRCGDLDPGVMLFLMQQGLSAQDLERIFYRESGLKGMSGLSSDVRVLRQSSSAEAAFALELFERRVIREAGGLIAQMGGVDAIAFTGGIGENDALLRAHVGQQLGFLGLAIDPALNIDTTKTGLRAIHRSDSSIEVWVAPTDEGMIAARQALSHLF